MRARSGDRAYNFYEKYEDVGRVTRLRRASLTRRNFEIGSSRGKKWKKQRGPEKNFPGREVNGKGWFFF